MAKWRAMVARRHGATAGEVPGDARHAGDGETQLCIAATDRYPRSMTSARHRRVRLHRLWLVLLALCILAKPTLDLIGELHNQLHELAHAGAGAAGALDTPDERAEHDAPPAGWHALMHLDPCCSASALPAFATATAQGMPDVPVAHERRLRVPPSPRRDLLRPPIAG